MTLVKRAVGLFIFLGVLIVALTAWFYHSIPSLRSVDFNELVEESRAAVKKEIKNPKSFYRWTPLQDVSREARYAIIVSEDAGFYRHDGIDFEAISNSFEENLKRGGYFFGASTIPQQVVKNVFLTKEKSLIRKLREAILARRLVKQFKRDQILEVYLNIIELGPDIYGIAAASLYYFKKMPGDLNAAEGAFLGLLLPSPVKRHRTLFLKKEMPKIRQEQIKRVLHDLEALKIIDQDQLEQYLHYRFFGDPPESIPENLDDGIFRDDSEDETSDETEIEDLNTQ